MKQQDITLNSLTEKDVQLIYSALVEKYENANQAFVTNLDYKCGFTPEDFSMPDLEKLIAKLRDVYSDLEWED